MRPQESVKAQGQDIIIIIIAGLGRVVEEEEALP
jgi:hypothetical protein